MKIAPSLMCSDFSELKKEIVCLDDAGIDFYHLDVMDGLFVPNYALGIDFIKSVRSLTNKPLDLHLMIDKPERHLDLFMELNVDMISVHMEATNRLYSLLKQLQSHDIKAGVALNPETPIESLEYILDVTDYIVLMTVSPGFAGQRFIDGMYQKIEKLREFLLKKNKEIEIQVDGNISFENIKRCKESGATMFIGGTSSIFNSTNTLEENVVKMRECLKTY